MVPADERHIFPAVPRQCHTAKPRGGGDGVIIRFVLKAASSIYAVVAEARRSGQLLPHPLGSDGHTMNGRGSGK